MFVSRLVTNSCAFVCIDAGREQSGVADAEDEAADRE